jgi:hypothetical protein
LIEGLRAELIALCAAVTASIIIAQVRGCAQGQMSQWGCGNLLAPCYSVCGPKFCSMNYSSKVDEYNKQVHGIEKKDYSELVERLVSIK